MHDSRFGPATCVRPLDLRGMHKIARHEPRTWASRQAGIIAMYRSPDDEIR